MKKGTIGQQQGHSETQLYTKIFGMDIGDRWVSLHLFSAVGVLMAHLFP